ARFGFDGALAHRLAAGRDHRPLAVRHPPADLVVTADHDEPIERVDAAAFAARVLAEQLHERLAAHGLACTRLGIEAVTAHGQELHRVWRHDGLLTAAAIADRVRWQLDGWLSGGNRRAGARPARPTAGIIRLRLIPDGVLAQAGLQPGLWGETGEERERAHRALSRVQGILGPEAVLTAVLGGGRSPADQVRLVPWGDERLPARPGPPPLPDPPSLSGPAPLPGRSPLPGEPAIRGAGDGDRSLDLAGRADAGRSVGRVGRIDGTDRSVGAAGRDAAGRAGADRAVADRAVADRAVADRADAGRAVVAAGHADGGWPVDQDGRDGRSVGRRGRAGAGRVGG
ncbi:DNA polymerase Y family protein, partial [Micromonospora sp. R77]|nr:DNA polymerase Y family protein [Micromonospora sp. R77]